MTTARAVWTGLLVLLGSLATPAVLAPASGIYYTAGSIVNAATNLNGGFAPNTIITIYGTGLSFMTVAADAAAVSGGALPTELGGVHVIIDGRSAGLYYASPTQVNLLIPNDLLPGPSKIVVAHDGLAGPVVPLPLDDVAPGLFTAPNLSLLATHATGELISATAPAQPGEWVVLYCVGLGRTVPDLFNGEVALRAQPIAEMRNLSVLVDNTPLGSDHIYYAGVAPGYAGLYQINARLPDVLGHDPEIRVSIGAQISRPATFLPSQ